VDLNKYGDYLTVVNEPMDLSKIRRKVEKCSYLDSAVLKRDMHLMFDNAIAYNSGDAGKDMRIMTSTLRVRELIYIYLYLCLCVSVWVCICENIDHTKYFCLHISN